jgi:hypothetical protein
MNPKIQIEVTPEFAAAVKRRHDMLWDVCREFLTWATEREILLSHGLSDALPANEPEDARAMARGQI